MTELQQVRPDGRGVIAFFKGFLRRPSLVGALMPSSRFVERRLVSFADVSNARLVVELGPGTGGTTRAMLDALPAGGRLLAIEIDPVFAARLRAQGDPRLIVHEGCAQDIGEALRQHDLPAPDAVVSGIPFSLMPPGMGRAVIRAVWSCLAPGGRFVAYQYRGQVAAIAGELLGSPRSSSLELFNMPPTRLFSWQKPAVA